MKSILLFCAFFSSMSAGSTARLELIEAKQIAIQKNLDVIALRRELDEKKASAGISRAAFLPTFGLAGGAETNQGGRATALGYAYANLNLFRGFSDTYRSQISDIDVDIAQARLSQAEFRVGLEVEEKFHGYVFRKKLMELKQEALKLNDQHKAMASRRRGSGMAADSDVIEFDLRESILKSDFMLLSQESEETRIQLRRLLGEEIGSAVEPIGGLQHQHLKGTLMDYLGKLKETSESIKLAGRELARAAIESKLWRTRWLPEAGVEAQAGYLSLDDQPPSGGMGLKAVGVVKFELFSGFATLYQRSEGEAKRLKAEARLKQAIQTALTDTETAFRRLKTVQDRVDVEEMNEERATKYYNAVTSEYRRGVKNSADVKVAAETLYEARARREGFKFDFLKQKIDLERAIGSPLETEIHPN